MAGSVYDLFILIIIYGISYGNQAEDFEMGCNLFEDVVNSKVFVDKSNLIKEFFNYRWTLITAPHNFGKSTNMNMLKTFFELSVDDYGNKTSIEETDNYKIFMNNKLKICEDKVFINTHFGSYPVIFLDFKRLNCSNYNSFIYSFKRLIRGTFIYHKYLLISNHLDEEAKCEFNKFYEDFKIEDLKDNELYYSIYTLSRLLFTHFNYTKSIILIDKFDLPIQKFIAYGGSGIEKIFSFIIEFISITLKTNFYVERSLINALIKPNILINNANNIQIISVLKFPSFSKYYGFTEKEVKDLLKKFNISENIDNVRSWYNGYQVKYNKVNIYNMYSIIKYLETNKLQNNWANCENVHNIQTLFTYSELNERIEYLLDNFKGYLTEEVIINYHVFTINHIYRLNKIIMRNINITSNDVDLLLEYLVDNGYFKIVEENDDSVIIKIPNKELYNEINMRISTEEYFIEKFKSAYKEFCMIPKHFYNITENNFSFSEIVNCIADLYYNSEFPKFEYMFRRDIYMSIKKSQLFDVEKNIINIGKGYAILLKSKDKKAVIIVGIKLISNTVNETLQEIIDGNNFSVQYSDENINIKLYIVLNLYKNYRCSLTYLINNIDTKKAVTVISKIKPKKGKSSWTPERTERHRQYMIEYWRNRNSQEFNLEFKNHKNST